MPEITLVCDECQESFLFSEADQAYCVENAFPPPSRCDECTRRRKDAKAEAKGGQRRGGHRRHRR
jgi:hypothetical protein